jgi:large subunit ribosomal protein L4
LWVGGGVAFGPHPRSYKFSMPRKARRLAIKCALTAKINDGGLVVVESITFAEPKTKDAIKFLGSFEAKDAKSLIITADNDEIVAKSSRNIPGVKAIGTIGLNVVDLLHHDKVLVTKEAVAKIEEVLA